MSKTKNTIYKSIRKETAPPTKTFKTRKGELARKAKHKGKDDDCVHPSKLVGRYFERGFMLVYEYYCPDCEEEWEESNDY